MKRAYDTSQRDQAKQDTRDRIIDAVVEVVTREGVHAFSVQNVANAAGVALRTVYRHFATREALLEGLDDLLERRVAQSGFMPPPLDNLDDLPDAIAPMFRMFDASRDAMRAYVVISVALGRTVPRFDQRTRKLREQVAKRFPSLAPGDARAAAAMIRLLCSTRSWFHLTTELDLTSDAAAGVVSNTLRVLFADLASRPKKRSR